jgi:hypothetical protein
MDINAQLDDSSACPKLQGSLGLCWVYNLYWVIVEDKLSQGSIQTLQRRQIEENLCSSSFSADGYKHKDVAMQDDYVTRFFTTRSDDKNTQNLIKAHSRHACHYDVIILLLAMYVHLYSDFKNVL